MQITWVLLFIFASGSCESMIQLIIFPSIHYSLNEVGILIAIYTFSTRLIMFIIVVLGYFSAQLFEFKNQEKYLETISAAIIVICGIGIFFWSGKSFLEAESLYIRLPADKFSPLLLYPRYKPASRQDISLQMQSI